MCDSGVHPEFLIGWGVGVLTLMLYIIYVWF